MNDELAVGMEIPVFGQQVRGQYIDGGRRYSHFAVPGWYQVAAIDGKIVTLRKIGGAPHAEVFECGADAVKAVLFANLECVAGGLTP